MYVRWIERKGFKIDIIDFQPGDEAGIKSVTFSAAGKPYNPTAGRSQPTSIGGSASL